MRFVFTVFLALLLVSIESVVVKYLGFSVTRIDVTIVLVVFLATRATLLEGASSAFAIGYLLDVSSGRPTGLYTFLAVLMFLLVRIGASLVDVRSLPTFLLFVSGADVGHWLLASFFGWMTSKGGASTFSVGSLVAQMLLTAIAALLLWPLLKRIDPGNERPEAGVLR